MKILLLSDSTGGGHTRAAEAVAECLKSRHPYVQTLIADSLKIVSPLIDRLVIGAYLNTVRNTPNIYGKLYDLSEKGEGLTDVVKTLNRLISFRLCSFISAYAPSAIVCTHTIPLQMLSSLKGKGRITVPVLGLVTDFVNHHFWKLDGIDAFIVAHEHIKKDMVKMGIPAQKIYTFGIPVSRSFLGKKKDRRQLLAAYGLEDKLTLLLMGGSLGFGGIKDTFASMVKCRRDFQIIALTGYNARLKKQLEAISAGSSKNIRIFDYTDNVPELMDMSDFVITKPGGMTISESLVKRLPILISSPIPGQEERNARFLVSTGAAVRINKNEDMDDIFTRIIDDPAKVSSMKEIAEKLARPRAGEDIARLIEAVVSGCDGVVGTGVPRELLVNPGGLTGPVIS